MNNKTLKLILPICFILASFGIFDLAGAEATSIYKHVEYGTVVNKRYCLQAIGIPCPPPPLPNFICSPFVSKFVLTSTGQVFLTPTDSITTPDAINWQGQHATKEEAGRATIASLESCLTANGFITPFYINYNFSGVQQNGWGLYMPNRGYWTPKIYKAWVYKDINQIVKAANGTFTGTARQVTSGDSDHPEVYVRLHTTICAGQDSSYSCPVLDVSVPTSQNFIYEVDLKVNGFDALSVDPVSDIALSWTVSDPDIKNCVASGDWSGNKALGATQSESFKVQQKYRALIFQKTPAGTNPSCSPWVTKNSSGVVTGVSSSQPRLCWKTGSSLYPCTGPSSTCVCTGSSTAYPNYVGSYNTAGESTHASAMSLYDCETSTPGSQDRIYMGGSQAPMSVLPSLSGAIPNLTLNWYPYNINSYRYWQYEAYFSQAIYPSIYPESGANPKTYTLTCDYFGTQLSDSVVVNINDLSAPDAPRNVQVDTGIDNNRLPGNTVTWNAPVKTGSEIIGYEIVKYNFCDSKTAEAIKTDVDSGVIKAIPLGLSLEFKDSFVTSGSRYTYAIRTENQLGGKGPFAVSSCSETTPARQQLFTLTGSGFKDSMSISLVNDTTQDVLSCDAPNIPNDTTLTVECDITDFTPVGRWNIVVSEDGVKTYESPADVFLSIIPKDNSLAPSDVSFSALNPSVTNGTISIDSITGKNISESATVELVSGSDLTKRIPCVTPLSQITNYNSDGSMTLNGVKCDTNNLNFDIKGSTDWKVIVKNSLATNGLSSDLSVVSTSLACTPNCTGKVCGSDQCGGFCKDTDGLNGTLIKACTNSTAYGTCAGTGTKTCVNGTYSACNVTSRDPRLDNCLGMECGDNKCGGQCGFNYFGCAGKGIQYTCNTTTSKCVCSSPVWVPNVSNMCGLVRQTSTNCSPSINQLVNGGLTVPSGYKCVNNQVTIDTAQCNKAWVQYNKCVPNRWECGMARDLCGNAHSCNADMEGECNATGYGCKGHSCEGGSEEGSTD